MVFRHSLPRILTGLSSSLLITAAALAGAAPSYETPEVRIAPRSAAVVDNGRQLHIVVVVENSLDDNILIGVSGKQAETYAFNDTGGKWTLGDPPAGAESTYDACASGTPIQPGERRSILYRLVSPQSQKVTAVTFGTLLYKCVEGNAAQLRVSIDGVSVVGQ